jgi:hypothetical protein
VRGRMIILTTRDHGCPPGSRYVAAILLSVVSETLSKCLIAAIVVARLPMAIAIRRSRPPGAFPVACRFPGPSRLPQPRHDAPPFRADGVGVNGGGRHLRVPQQFLDDVELDALLDAGHGVAVPQPLRRGLGA